ncbi:MAG: 50S ribosomal protein L29 [Chitinophagales bacterium]|jgi:large subunit ribosomal protein L29
MAKQNLVLADKSAEELQAELGSLQGELTTMKFDHAVKGLANPMELRQMRRNIARIMTELRQRELSSMPAESLEMRSKIRARRRRQK